MPELEFIGDWEPIEAQTIAAQLQKSLGVGDGGGAEITVQHLEDNPTQQLLSKRQKRLIEMLREAGNRTFRGGGELAKAADYLGDEPIHECGPGCIHSWDDYILGGGGLLKSVGSLKRDAQGRTYVMNRNNRWERFAARGGTGGGMPEFRFTAQDGEFGRGVYFPVLASPQGYMRLRVRANLSGPEMISDSQFHDIETDFARDANLVLDAKGVRAIAQSQGDSITLLCVRSPSDLEVLGAVAGSGQLPPGGDYEYRLAKLTPADDHWVIDLEVSPKGDAPSLQGNELIKAASVFPNSPLSGTVLTSVGKAKLERQMVRSAVERCRLDGVPVDSVSIELVSGVPDFLPPTTCAFCLPTQGTVYLVHHDPQAALDRRLRMLTRELKAAATAHGVPYDVALDTVLRCQEIDAEWWLEGLIKRYVGAILTSRVACPLVDDLDPWLPYLGLLPGRGLTHWGNRRLLAECMAEDYRCAHDPAGFPNAITMLWDLALPTVARMAQQRLLEVLNHGR